MTELLNEVDVERIVRLIASLEQSPFDFLELRVGDLHVTLGKGEPPAAGGGGSTTAAPITAAPAGAATPPASATPASAPLPGAPTPAAATPAAAKPADTGITDGIDTAAGTVEVTAPIMGMYYAQPAPGADPYVRVGGSVTADTTVALIEVMKTFNAVAAGVAGEIVQVCVENGQFVEYGQVLYRVRPA